MEDFTEGQSEIVIFDSKNLPKEIILNIKKTYERALTRINEIKLNHYRNRLEETKLEFKETLMNLNLNRVDKEELECEAKIRGFRNFSLNNHPPTYHPMSDLISIKDIDCVQNKHDTVLEKQQLTIPTTSDLPRTRTIKRKKRNRTKNRKGRRFQASTPIGKATPISFKKGSTATSNVILEGSFKSTNNNKPTAHTPSISEIDSFLESPAQ